jgi:integrase
MASINFLYRSSKNEAPLTLRLLFRSENTDFVLETKTSLIVSKEYWAKFHNLKRPKDIDIINQQIEIKNELNQIEKHVLNHFNESSQVNKQWLENTLQNYYNPKNSSIVYSKELSQYFDTYLELKNTELSKNTVKKINVIKSLLARYEEKRRKRIFIQDVDENFKYDFEKYCLENKYAHNTIAVALKFIKTVCNHANENGIEISPFLKKVKIKYQQIKNIYLSFEEIEKIEKTNNLPEYLINARDWLIISCYTGQRVSDFMRFNSDMIRIENGKHLLEFKQVKTNKIMTIPLHPKVLEILDRRNGEFPRALSDVHYNEYIKVVCKEAGINEPINGSKKIEMNENSKEYRKQNGLFSKFELVTSHIGRRSFATNFYGKIPTSFLIYITGHSTETMFLNYIGKSNKDLAMEIINYF